MHVTALPDGFRQHFPDRGFEAGVIIRDHELDAGQAAFSQAQKKVAPARPALAIGEFHGEDLPPAFPVHSNGHEYSLAHNDPALPDTLVTGIENEVRERVCKAPFGKRSQALVEGFVDGADRTRRKEGIDFGGLVADKAFDSDWIIENLNERGAKIVISQHPRRAKPLVIDADIYKSRHLIENFLCKTKEFKRIAMRSDKTDTSFTAMIHACAALINSR